MTTKEKYQAICGMESIGQFTKGEYPTYSEFEKAKVENRVSGHYESEEGYPARVNIVNNDPYKQYNFVSRGQ